MLSALQNLIFGHDRGVSYADLEEAAQRISFSKFLPWSAYDPESKLYYNHDDTVGYIFDCSPLAFASDQICDSLSGLFRMSLPERSVIQFILHGDKYIEHILDNYVRTKTRANEVDYIKEAVLNYSDFLRKGTNGMDAMQGIPLRDFRLLVAVKVPASANYDLKDLYNNVVEILKISRLIPDGVPPEDYNLSPPFLVDFIRKIINDRPSPNNFQYNDNIPINKQVIFSDTVIDSHRDYLKVGDRFFRCATVKNFPKSVSAIQTNQLFGGYKGVEDDSKQINAPFLYSLNIVWRKLTTKLHAACNLVLQQKALGSFAPSLARRQAEFVSATDQIEHGMAFFYIIPTLWVWGNDANSSSQSISRAKALWEDLGYVMQEDKFILSALLTLSLPLGLYDVGNNLEIIDRCHTVPADVIPSILPVQTDFCGGGKNFNLLFPARKGQMGRLDFFSESSGNYNGFIGAFSGAGKSFLVNFIVFNYWAAGAKIRILDIGHSYKKASWIFGAKFLDFGVDSDVCLNPFTNILNDDPESLNYDLSIISLLIFRMCYAAAGPEKSKDPETEHTLVNHAVRWAWETQGRASNIDTVHDYLHNYDAYNKDSSGAFHSKLTDIAHSLAYNLLKFTTSGTHGRWFNGVCTFDIKNDDFVVLELERLKDIPDLFSIVTFQVLNEMTRELYHSDKQHPRFAIFDEAHLFIESGEFFRGIIEQGYRRARKYRAAFLVITQSILDLEKFGDVGRVIWGNSSFKLLLQSPDFDLAKEKKLINYSPFAMMLLKSVRKNSTKYSEVFADTPFGEGIFRVCVDNYSYFLYTSAAAENAEMEQLIKGGMNRDEAIKEMIRKYRAHS
jgi:conjugal transfer ATP-binding protein TraC